MPSDRRKSFREGVRQFTEVALGPWPIRPLILGVFVFATINVSQTTADYVESTRDEVRFVWFENVIPSLAITLAVISPLLVAEFLRKRVLRRPLTRAWYLISLTTSSLLGSVALLVLLVGFSLSLVGLYEVLALGLRLLVTEVAILAVFGFAERKLEREVDRANMAATQLMDQKELMIRTEELSRRAVADFLHDRVQSMLVTSTMQLREIAGRTDEQSQSELQSVAEYLDDLRSIDVREANTRLSPNIAVVGLGVCIEQLIASLDPTVEYSVHIDSELREWAARKPDVDITPLGLFRIVEQSASNSVVHGHARRIDVAISAHEESIHARVVDDGQGLPAEETPGTGTSVIDSWTQVLRGTWQRSTRSEGGVEVTITVPRSRQVV